MLASVFFPIVGASLAACSPQVTDKNIDALNRQFTAAERSGKTVSQKEVEAILGQPTDVKTFQIEQQTVRTRPMVRYHYVQNGKTVELHFIDNELQNRVVHFGEKPPETAPLKMSPRVVKESP